MPGLSAAVALTKPLPYKTGLPFLLTGVPRLVTTLAVVMIALLAAAALKPGFFERTRAAMPAMWGVATGGGGLEARV